MKKLDQIKDEVARQFGFRDFDHVREHDRKGLFEPAVLEEINDKVALVYAEQFAEKAERYDKLNAKISECYSEENEDNDDIDLGTIGEIAASHYGYL